MKYHLFADPAMPGSIIQQNYTAPDITLRWGSSQGFVEVYELIVLGAKETTVDNTSQISLTGLVAGRTYDVSIIAKKHGRTSNTMIGTFTTQVAGKIYNNFCNVLKIFFLVFFMKKHWLFCLGFGLNCINQNEASV